MKVRSGFRFATVFLALAGLIFSPLGCANWGAGVHLEGGNSSVSRGHGKGHPSHPHGGPPGQMKKHGKQPGKQHGKHGHNAHEDAGVSVSVEGTMGR